MSIKLSDYIDNLKNAFTDEEWLQIYEHAYSLSEEDAKLAEELMEVSNEALRIEFENGSTIEGVNSNGDIFHGRGIMPFLFMKGEDE